MAEVTTRGVRFHVQTMPASSGERGAPIVVFVHGLVMDNLSSFYYTLANPVAGYSSFRVRIRDHFKDLGDSEQTPCDLATLADYTHLTALRAPRHTGPRRRS